MTQLRILLVEDEPAHEQIIRRSLGKLSVPHELIAAGSLREARRRIADTPPDLLLIDVRLPDGNGLDLIRFAETAPSCPILVLTGQGDERTAVEALKAGALDYVVKTRETLSAMPQIVERALREWRHIVERREAEREIVDQKARLELLVSQLPALMWSVDRDMVITSSQGAGLTVLGVKPGQLVGKTLFQYHGTDDPTFYPIAQHYRALAGEVQRYEFEWEGVAFQTHLEPQRDGAGNIVGVLGLATDVSAIKEQQETLRKARDFYLTLLDDFPFMIWRAGRDGKPDYFNGTWLAFTGRTLEDEVGGGWTKGIHPHDLDRVRRVYEEGFHTRESFRLEYRLRREDTEYRWVYDVGRPYDDAQGNFMGFIGAVEDITDRVRADRKFRGLLESAPDAMVISDDHGRIELVNSRTRQMFGYTASELMGKPVDTLIPHRLRDPNTAFGIGYFVDPESDAVPGSGKEMWGLRKDGTEFPIEATQSLVESGPRTLIATAVRDVSDRKQVEVQKSRLEEELRLAQKMEALGVLSGGIAHDFNNILTPIIGYAHLALQDLDPDSRSHSDVEQIMKAAKRAKHLVHQILTFGRQAEADRRPIRIAEVATEVLELIRPGTPKGVTLDAKIDPDAGTLLADAAQIHQVILNLCTNAFQAMAATGGRLSLGVRRVESKPGGPETSSPPEPGPWAEVRVADTGHGMDAATLTRIFEPFFTTKRIGEGTGLGLSVIHGIVTAHGGDVRVYSDPGRGTEFMVYLPLTTEAVAAAGEPAGAVPGHHERILVVDDELMVAEMIREMLVRLGYEAEVETDPTAARERVRRDPNMFDLIVTDEVMPRLSGSELATAVRGLNPELPIVLMSGFGDNIPPDPVAAPAIRASILKPITTHELSLVVNRALASRAPREVPET